MEDFRPVKLRRSRTYVPDSTVPAADAESSSGMSLSSFAQSAIKDGAGKVARCGDKLGEKTSYSGRSKRRSATKSKKKILGVRDWDKLKWEGRDKDTPIVTPTNSSNSSDSDIQSYSDRTDSDDQHQTHQAIPQASNIAASQSIALISSDEEFDEMRGRGREEDFDPGGEMRGCAIVRKKIGSYVRRVEGQDEAGTSTTRKKMGIGSFLYSTPIKDHCSKISSSKVIADIQSSSSDSADDAIPVEPPPSSLLLSLSRPVRKTGRTSTGPALPFGLKPNVTPPSHMTISTPPSSPEVDPQELEDDIGRLKASDWIKQVHTDNPSEGPGPSVTLKTPVDSAKKKPSKRLVPGGVAERLQRLIRREKSEITFWEHRTRTFKDEDTDLSQCVTVHVQSLRPCCSVVMSTCNILHGYTATPPSATPDMGTGEDMQAVTVLFSLRSAQFVGLAPGKHIRIHPPWQTCRVECGEVILCPHFCMSVGFSPVPSRPPLPSPLTHTGAGTSTVPSRSPVKGGLVPTRLFTNPTPSAKRRLQTTPPTSHYTPVGGLKPRPHTSRAGDMSAQFADSPMCLLDALAGAREDVVPGFTATIVSVFRRGDGYGVATPMWRDGGGGTRKEEAVCPPLSKLASGDGGVSQSSWSWSLLVRDDMGAYAEIRMPCSDTVGRPMWGVLVEGGEGKQCYFAMLRLLRRMTSRRDPGLFSVMASRSQMLCGSLPADEQESNYLGAGLGDGPSSHFICYQMEWLEVTHYRLCAAGEGGGDTSDEECRVQGTGAASGRGRGNRVNILAKVISFEPEISLPSLHGRCRAAPVLCGHFLTILTNTPATPPSHSGEGGEPEAMASESKERGEDPLPIKVYLKQGFVLEGLSDVVNSHGVVVFLRDVLVQQNPGPLPWSYSMDVCSLMIPVHPHDLCTLYPAYPPNLKATATKLSSLAPMEKLFDCD